ncbi:MAG: heavy-metal-associated domain-containing protein [Alistipes sp.]|nr:heavy-metal-associated domain-containing protein [Alistipes sp.]
MFCLLAVLSFGVADAMAQKKGGDVKTTVFVTDIDCEGCAKKVTNSIPFVKGVKDVKVDVPTKTVTVTYDAAKSDDATLVKAFAKIKIKAQVAPKKK